MIDMKLRSLDEAGPLRGKRVLLRVDFNVRTVRGRVPDEGGWRLRRTLPTVRRLLMAGAKVILASHRGRPDGRKAAAERMAPVAKRFSEMLGRPVKALPDCVGKKVQKAILDMKDGEVVMLENLRFKKGEDENDEAFAEELAALAELYVNDAFAVSHRKAASVVAVARLLPSYAGFLLLEEVAALEKAMDRPERPLVAVLGGAKVASKIGVLEAMLEKAERVLLGGALIVPFFQHWGYGVGASRMGEDETAAAKKLAASPRIKRLLLPIDVLVGDPSGKGRPRVVELASEPSEICREGEAIVDIGPKTVSAYASFLRSAKTIVWNGPLGLFEVPKYAHGTLAVGRLIAARSKRQAYGLVGGGETVMALEMTGLADCVDHVSTGGGAMLEFIEGKPLPGLEALKKK